MLCTVEHTIVIYHVRFDQSLLTSSPLSSNSRGNLFNVLKKKKSEKRRRNLFKSFLTVGVGFVRGVITFDNLFTQYITAECAQNRKALKLNPIT